MRHMSYSRLKDFEISPGYYKWRLQQPFKASPAMILGNAIDKLLFSGREAFDRKYVVKPDGCDMRTKAGKEWAASVEGREIVGAEVHAVVESILDYAPAADLIDTGTAQDRWEWTHDTGVPMVSVPDFWSGGLVGHGRVIDLKTTVDPDPIAFAKSAHSLRYHWQSQLYLEAAEQLCSGPWEFFWIVAQSCAPYRVEVYQPDPAWLSLAQVQTTDLLQRYKAHSEADSWPLSSGGVHVLTPPAWAWREQ